MQNKNEKYNAEYVKDEQQRLQGLLNQNKM